MKLGGLLLWSLKKKRYDEPYMVIERGRVDILNRRHAHMKWHPSSFHYLHAWYTSAAPSVASTPEYVLQGEGKNLGLFFNLESGITVDPRTPSLSHPSITDPPEAQSDGEAHWQRWLRRTRSQINGVHIVQFSHWSMVIEGKSWWCSLVFETCMKLTIDSVDLISTEMSYFYWW